MGQRDHGIWDYRQEAEEEEGGGDEDALGEVLIHSSTA